MNSPMQPRQIIPPFPESTSTNQQVLYGLASGTGGFPIFNSNDLLGGLDKVSRELDEYYILGYKPPNQSDEESCHAIRVKVERSGTQVRARSGYCSTKGSDLLAGKAEGKTLEQLAASSQPGSIPVSLRAPYFYTGPHVARVNLSVGVPAQSFNFEKKNGISHAELNVLGLAIRDDGVLGARFSDTVKLDLEKKELKEFLKSPYSYRNTFGIAPGKYTLKIALSAGGTNYGKYETPLAVEEYNGKQFQLSAVALSDNMQPVSDLAQGLDAALLEERTPLLVQGLEVVPSPNNRFARDKKVALYVEVYASAPLDDQSPRVGILYDVIDTKTHQPVKSSNTILVNGFGRYGNPVIPVEVRLPVEELKAGEYRLEVRARDSEGNVSAVRSADFALN
jgi:hypothetical protein